MNENNENKKICNGYEAMFTFLNETDFLEHLKVCDECASEHARMQRVSQLIREAKPYIREKQKSRNILKSAAAVFVIAFATLSVPLCMTGVSVYDDYVVQNTLTVEEMGMPVDEYGFLYVE